MTSFTFIVAAAGLTLLLAVLGAATVCAIRDALDKRV